MEKNKAEDQLTCISDKLKTESEVTIKNFCAESLDKENVPD